MESRRVMVVKALAFLCLALVLAAPAWARSGTASVPPAGGTTKTAADLARETQNPIANLISLPFQNNTSFSLGRNDQVQDILNVQPVIPFSLGKEWLLITRTILPIVYQPDVTAGHGGGFGTGDLNISAFLAPNLEGSWVFGAGPIMQFPTASFDLIRTGEWALGPTAVGVYQQGPWVVGALVNNIFSFAGDSDRPRLNQMTLQPFANYNLPGAWYLVSAPLVTANWKANPSDRWLVPLGGGVGRVFKVGELPINTNLQLYYNVVNPDNTRGPQWTVRFVVQFLFPK